MGYFCLTNKEIKSLLKIMKTAVEPEKTKHKVRNKDTPNIIIYFIHSKNYDIT